MKKIFLITFLVSIIISSFILSCTTDKKTWEVAKKNNDILSYEYYQEIYPNGKYLDDAKYLIRKIIEFQGKKPLSVPKPLTPPIAFWNDMILNNICLQISIISVPRSKTFEIEKETQYFDFFKESLAESGITVHRKSTNCKAKMKITLKVNRLGAYYDDKPVILLNSNYDENKYRYTGYDVQGEISLTTDGQAPITLSINRKKPIKDFISQSDGTDYSMPFLRRLDFADFIYKVWGVSPLIWIEWNGNKVLRSSEYKGQLSKYDINSVTRAVYCNEYTARINALKIIKSGNLKLEPNQAIILVTYNIRNFGLRYEKNLNDVCLEALNNIESSVIDVAPVLIKYMDERIKKGWRDNGLIQNKLETITGNNFKNDISRWREWWFNHKKSLID